MELYERNESLVNATQDFFLRYNWNWFCTLDLQVNTDCYMAECLLKTWRNKIATHDHIRIAYMGVFNTNPYPCIYLLVLGNCNRINQTLLDLDYVYWADAWYRLTKCRAVIEPIYEPKEAAALIAKTNLHWDRLELIKPHNISLLSKSMLRRYICLN
jgi:hypothetical protein